MELIESGEKKKVKFDRNEEKFLGLAGKRQLIFMKELNWARAAQGLLLVVN